MKKFIIGVFVGGLIGVVLAGFPGSPSPQSRALLDAQTQARSLKTYVTNARDAMAAGSVSANLVTECYLKVVVSSAVFNSAKQVPGITQYAKDQFNDQNLNVVQTFNVMLGTIGVVISEIQSTYPVDGNGWLLERKFSVDGFNTRSFTPAQTVNLRSKLTDLIATID